MQEQINPTHYYDKIRADYKEALEILQELKEGATQDDIEN